MAGFIEFFNGKEIEFHIGNDLSYVQIADVKRVQFDCHELEHVLKFDAHLADFTPDQSRVRAWQGASARRIIALWIADFEREMNQQS